MSETKPEDYFKLQPILSKEQLAAARFVELSMARYYIKAQYYNTGDSSHIYKYALNTIDREIFEMVKAKGKAYIEGLVGKLDDGPGIKP